MNGTDWNENGPAESQTGQNMQEEEQQEFEAALGRALRRVDAPEGFAARIAAMAEAEERTKAIRAAEAKPKPWWQLSWGWKPAWGGMAALLVAGVLTGHVIHDRDKEANARALASQQFDVSMQITDQAMEHAREQLQRAGVGLDGEQ